MSNPNYPEGVSESDIDRIGEPLDGGNEMETVEEMKEIEKNNRELKEVIAYVKDTLGSWIYYHPAGCNGWNLSRGKQAFQIWNCNCDISHILCKIEMLKE